MPEPTIEQIQNELKNQIDARAKAVASEILGLLNSGTGLQAIKDFVKLQQGMKATGGQSLEKSNLEPALQPSQAQGQQQEKQLQEKKRQEMVALLNPIFLRQLTANLLQQQLLFEKNNQENQPRPDKIRPIGDPDEEEKEALENDKSNEPQEPDPQAQFLKTLEKMAEEKVLLENANMLNPLAQKFENALNPTFNPGNSYNMPQNILQNTLNGTEANNIINMINHPVASLEKAVVNVVEAPENKSEPLAHDTKNKSSLSNPFNMKMQGPSPYNTK